MSVRFVTKTTYGHNTLLFPLRIAAYHLQGIKRNWAFSQLRQLGESDSDLAMAVSGGKDNPYPSVVAPVLNPLDLYREKFEELV